MSRRLKELEKRSLLVHLLGTRRFPAASRTTSQISFPDDC